MRVRWTRGERGGGVCSYRHPSWWRWGPLWPEFLPGQLRSPGFQFLLPPTPLPPPGLTESRLPRWLVSGGLTSLKGFQNDSVVNSNCNPFSKLVNSALRVRHLLLSRNDTLLEVLKIIAMFRNTTLLHQALATEGETVGHRKGKLQQEGFRAGIRL